MKVVKKGQMPDGTAIQLEDWSEDYPKIFSGELKLVAYPIAKHTTGGEFGPRRGESFRYAINGQPTEVAQNAYVDLVSGSKQLLDFSEYVDHGPLYTELGAYNVEAIMD
jgi:hypothetical protein